MTGKSKNLRAFVSSCEKEKPITPRLRFPEFRGDGGWGLWILGEKAVIKKGKGISKAEVVSDGLLECIRYGELYTHYSEIIGDVISRTKTPASKLVLSKADDVIIPASGETKLDIAKASCILREGIAIGGDLNIIRSKIDGSFLSYYLNGPLKTEIAGRAQGVSVMHLYPAQLAKVTLATPSKPEQQKIAECLGSLDDLIAAHSAKLDALQDHKKGLLQKLFPAEGQTTPELRFPGFEGEWDQKYLGKLCSITTGKLDANAMVKGGKYRFYTCAREFYHIDKYAFDTDALLVSGNGANVGYIHHYQGKFNAYQRTYVLDNFSENILFMKFFLDRNLRQRIELEKMDGNTPYIVRATLSEMEVQIPHRHEQQKIADCLCALDDQIAAQTDQIAALKEHKQGLMQQLFPTVES